MLRSNVFRRVRARVPLKQWPPGGDVMAVYLDDQVHHTLHYLHAMHYQVMAVYLDDQAAGVMHVQCMCDG